MKLVALVAYCLVVLPGASCAAEPPLPPAAGAAWGSVESLARRFAASPWRPTHA